MAHLMTGAPVAEAIFQRAAAGVELLHQHGIVPTAAIVGVGERSADLAYERGFTKRAESLGIQINRMILPADSCKEQVLDTIRAINENKDIHGCLLFRPLPDRVNVPEVLSALRPEKDIDAMTSASMGALITQNMHSFPPCTAEACMEILNFYNIPVKGKNVVMVGSGMAVGMPTSILLINAGATVSVCHIYTDRQRMAELCRSADIIISAAGKAGLITEHHVSPGQVIVDVGINVGADGKICGDVDFARVEPIVSAITPVPRGVGAVTSTVLASHTVEAALRENGLSLDSRK